MKYDGVVKSRHSLATVYLLSLFYLAGCTSALWSPPSYDSATYKSLTDMKPEVVVLYKTFADEDLKLEKIEAVRLRLAQIYEYEKGKGEGGIETIRQIEIIQRMFERDVKDRMENGRWNEVHLANQRQNITEAFDIAIQTERLKWSPE